MMDRLTVMGCLEGLTQDDWEQWYSDSEVQETAKAALSLLKEQETTFEKDGHHIMCKSCGAYWCDRDREGDQYPRNFCPNCGKAVKRERCENTL